MSNRNTENVFVSDKLIPDSHFLGDKTCKECHQSEYEKWQGSHHDKSMQIATRETILADFKGESFNSQGVY
ncbi:MAG: multiheme c-type cytochrome, partial [Flavicella sp.]